MDRFRLSIKPNRNLFCIILITLIVYSSLCITGFCGEWKQISGRVFGEKGDAGSIFRDAVFNKGYLYVITSDTNDIDATHHLSALWVCEVISDPNKWEAETQTRWDELDILGGARADKLFAGGDYAFIGVYDKECRLYKIKSPGSDKIRITIPQNLFETIGYNLADCIVTNGAVFDTKVYLGVYEDDYGSRIFYGDLSKNSLSGYIKGASIQLADPDIVGISLMKSIGDSFFIGTRKRAAGALLYYLNAYGVWTPFNKNKFSNASEAEKTANYISITELAGKAWLFTGYTDAQNKGWVIWESKGPSYNPSEWQMCFSSKDGGPPFADPQTIDVTSLISIGDYLYVGIIKKGSSELWKCYLGKEWIRVPSYIFDKGDTLIDIFKNHEDLNYRFIFAGTKGGNGSQILLRLVPSIDIPPLTLEDRFIGPQNSVIRNLKIQPNWGGVPSTPILASLISPDGEKRKEDLYHDGNFAWNFGGLNLKDGVYELLWDTNFGEDGERVIKHLNIAWDSNAPSIPRNIDVEPGNGYIIVYWDSSQDDFECSDANFSSSFFFNEFNCSETLLEYELEYGRSSDDPPKPPRLIVINANDAHYKYGEGRYRKKIDNLQNDVTYWIRLRAKDMAWNASDWSERAECTTEPDMGWTDLVGEKGGCFISSLIPKGREKEDDTEDSGEGHGKDDSEDTAGNTAVSEGKGVLIGLKGGLWKYESKDAELLYNNDEVWPIQLDMGISYRDNLEIAFDIGYMEIDGFTILAHSRRRSSAPVTFKILPCSVTLRWLPLYDQKRFLNPYFGTGIDTWFYKEDKINAKDIDGLKYGIHGTLGLRLLLDKLDLYHARLLHDDYKIINTYFIIEAVYNSIDNLGGSRLDMSGFIYRAGILFLF